MSFILTIKDSLTGRPYQVEGYEQSDKRSPYYNYYHGVPMVMPVLMKLRSESEWWKLPFEPWVTITGKNVLIKRNVIKAERGGSIKERWTADDYNITIEGRFLYPESFEYPTDDVQKLHRICTAASPVDVICPMFEALGITSMAIEDFDFPHTGGESAQDYVIKAVSDSDWNLLIENKNYVS